MPIGFVLISSSSAFSSMTLPAKCPNLAIKGTGGDWEEGKYWLEKIIQQCRSNGWTYVVVPAPYEPAFLGKRRTGHYPGMLSNVLDENSFTFLDPSDDMLNAHLELVVAGERIGKRPYGCPLFNGHIGDGHFSALGSKAWRRPWAGGWRFCSKAIRQSRWGSSDGMIRLRGRACVDLFVAATADAPTRLRVRGRRERLERTFKRSIALATVGSIALFLTVLSPGRYLASWTAARARAGKASDRAATGSPRDRRRLDAQTAV